MCIRDSCDYNTIQLDFEIERKENFTLPFSVEITNLPSTVAASFSKVSYPSNDINGSITLSGLNDLDAADYELNILAQFGTASEIFSIELNQRESSFEIPILLSPPDDTERESLTPEL